MPCSVMDNSELMRDSLVVASARARHSEAVQTVLMSEGHRRAVALRDAEASIVRSVNQSLARQLHGCPGNEAAPLLLFEAKSWYGSLARDARVAPDDVLRDDARLKDFVAHFVKPPPMSLRGHSLL